MHLEMLCSLADYIIQPLSGELTSELRDAGIMPRG